jgi:hypothetical protein
MVPAKTCLHCSAGFTGHGLAKYCRTCIDSGEAARDSNRRRERTHRATRNSQRVARYRPALEREKNTLLKRQALSTLSGGPPTCCACGETDLATLSIDHISGGGSRLRRAGESTGRLYARLVSSNANTGGLRCLCMNCQWRSRIYGADPMAWPTSHLTQESRPYATPDSASRTLANARQAAYFEDCHSRVGCGFPPGS